MPAAEKQKMMKLARDYILKRENLVCVCLLIDARLEMQKADREFLGFLGRNQLPFVLIFTKSDKLTQNRLDSNTAKFSEIMLESWESLPPVFMTSSLKKTGREEVLDFIEETLQ